MFNRSNHPSDHSSAFAQNQHEYHPVTDVLDRWYRFCRYFDPSIHYDDPGSTYTTGADALLESYHQSHRKYHNFHHLQNMFNGMDLALSKRSGSNLAGRLSDRDCMALTAAILFHDVVYRPENIPTPGENESLSADKCKTILQQITDDDAFIDRVCRMIERTANPSDLNKDSDITEKLLIDLDFRILGSDPDTYTEYTNAIRQEVLTRFTPKQFNQGRRDFLKRLDTDNLFHTDFFNDRLSDQAKRNIQRELRDLQNAEPANGTEPS